MDEGDYGQNEIAVKTRNVNIANSFGQSETLISIQDQSYAGDDLP